MSATPEGFVLRLRMERPGGSDPATEREFVDPSCEVLADAVEPDRVLPFCDADLVDEDGRPTGPTLWGELGFRRRQRDSLVSGPPGPMLRHSIASGCTQLVRREVVEGGRSLSWAPLTQTQRLRRVGPLET